MEPVQTAAQNAMSQYALLLMIALFAAALALAVPMFIERHAH
jgi:hypothetical protein